MKKGIGLALLSAALFATAPASAQSVDEKIKAMEQELTQLKEQQVELRKEATTAAAALPNFSYRPGGGLNIEAADKAWAINFGFEGHWRMDFEAGQDQAGRTNGEVYGRRARPQFVYCLNNCFYEIQHRFDNDGFGQNTALQRNQVSIHMEQINPYLPRVSFGMDGEMAVSTLRAGSGNFGAQAEYDLLSRNNGINTGRMGTGMTLNWDDIDIVSGRAQFNFGMGSFGQADDGRSINSDRKSFALFARVDPLSQMKNKWIEGLRLEYFHWWCNDDPRVSTPSTFDPAGTAPAAGNQSACANGLNVRDNGDNGRQALFNPSNMVGVANARGTQNFNLAGFGWKVGPYQLRATRGWSNYDFQNPRGAKVGQDLQAKNFLIAHDMFLWSPKGFLTGDSTIPGSVLLGQHFERTDASCGKVGATPCDASGQFNRNRILLREWDLWYFLPSRISIGGSVLWYDASNLDQRAGQAAWRLGTCNRPLNTTCTAGSGGNWTDVMLNFRMYF